MNIQIRIGEKDFNVSVEKRGGYFFVIASPEGAKQSQKSFSFSSIKQLGSSAWRLFAGNRPLSIVTDIKNDQITFWLDGEKITAQIQEAGAEKSETTAVAQGPFTLKSAMPGLVKKIKVRPGDRVEKGQGLLVLEAMKMENEIVAPFAGIVENIAVQEKQSVESNAILLRLNL